VKDDRLYLEHIREAIERITAYSAAGREEFLHNTMAQDAVIRNFEIIGEAAKRLSDDAKRKHPELPWSDIARFRDFLIHHYTGVNLKRVWDVIETHLPALRAAVDRLLEA